MRISTKNILLRTKGENDVIDISEKTIEAVNESSIENGLITIFVGGSTAAITTIEFEPGLRNDFPNMLARIAPKDIEYHHDKTWHDGNGHSHVRASLIGPSLTIPIIGGRLMTGRWQQIILLEMDIQSRDRNIIFQILGE
ncbi:MAG TPA: secondary thiamine-phosphate synthase enzyme YjbQ [Nitrososphaeraceae archaeon]|jgi:secondary thiamine-phosphate synthase enzyme